MTQDTIKENELISSFMNYTKIDSNEWVIEGIVYTSNSLKFNSSWDWIMKVFDKIHLGNFTHVTTSRFGIKIRAYDVQGDLLFQACPNIRSEEDTLLLVAHRAVIRYIEWFNEEQNES